MTSNKHPYLESLDDEALLALGNKGLVRRAEKLLEKEQPQLPSDWASSATIELQLANQTVQLQDSGPLDARCSCPAPGICAHKLAALRYMREQAVKETAAELPVSGDECIKTNVQHGTPATNVSLDPSIWNHQSLRKFAGKAAWDKALELALASRQQNELTETGVNITSSEANISVRLNEQLPTVYLFPHGPAASICKADANHAKTLITAAGLLYLNQYHSESLPAAAEAKPEPDHGLTAEQMNLLGRVRKSILQMVDLGLAHLSDSSRIQFASYAVLLKAADMPRLGLLSKRLSNQISQLLNRHAQADILQLSEELSELHALCSRLMQAHSDVPDQLSGSHRSQYHPIADQTIICMGCYGWQTKSDFRGITALFWSISEKRWLSWSDSRGDKVDIQFDPQYRYQQAAPWQLGSKLEAIVGKKLQLQNALCNQAGRLSSSEKTQAMLGDELSWEELSSLCAPIDKWSDIPQNSPHSSLGQGSSQPRFVLLQATKWSTKQYDDVKQQFVWNIEDHTGQTLSLRCPFVSHLEYRIRALENLSKPAAILCELSADDSALPLIAYHSPSRFQQNSKTVQVLDFYSKDQGRLSSRQSPFRVPAWFEKAKRQLERKTAADSQPTVLHQHSSSPVLARLTSCIQNMLEFGRATDSELDKLTPLAKQCQNIGWPQLGAAVSHYEEILRLGKQPQSAETLLKLHWVLLQFQRMEISS